MVWQASSLKRIGCVFIAAMWPQDDYATPAFLFRVGSAPESISLPDRRRTAPPSSLIRKWQVVQDAGQSDMAPSFRSRHVENPDEWMACRGVPAARWLASDFVDGGTT